MKRIALIAALAALSAPAISDTLVNGYTRSDGTYVAPHYRSDANSNRYDNYSSQGNTNPYTGQRGHERNELSSPPTYNQPSPYYQTPNSSNGYGYGAR